MKSGNRQRIDVVVKRVETNANTAGASAHNLNYAVNGGDCKQCVCCYQFLSSNRLRRHLAKSNCDKGTF